MSTPEEVRASARLNGLISGALHRGEVWPVGTLVRWKGRRSKNTYRVTGIHLVPGTERFLMQITPLNPGPGRGECNTAMEYLRVVDE